MKGIRQRPKLKGGLPVYHMAMLPRGDGEYELVVYGKDKHGRKWCAGVDLSDQPRLLAGERVFDDEVVEVDE